MVQKLSLSWLLCLLGVSECHTEALTSVANIELFVSVVLAMIMC